MHTATHFDAQLRNLDEKKLKRNYLTISKLSNLLISKIGCYFVSHNGVEKRAMDMGTNISRTLLKE